LIKKINAVKNFDAVMKNDFAAACLSTIQTRYMLKTVINM